jgi:sortase (surface protein transpeptidase)
MERNVGRVRSRPSLLVAVGSAVVVSVVTLGLVVGAPNGIAGQVRAASLATPTLRPLILETPRPAPTAVPWVEPNPVPLPPRQSGCPQLNNPGGRVTWIPSDDAGPWPTDGTVSIPTIGTSAPIVRVGVDHESQMVVPPSAGPVSWLDQGGIPGQTNNIVLAGHVTWAGVPGAFHRIGDLLPGDMIVLSIEGRRMIFKTVWVCEFPRASTLAPRIMGYTDVPSVTLITCHGAWDSAAGTHADRIVARAELVY